MRSAASRLHKGFSFAKRFQGCSDWICCDGAAWAGRWDAWAPGGTVRGKAFSHVVLDLGCGSGILAIAALRLGASHATGVDIDPKAVDVAYENAALNDIGRDRCRFLAGNVLADQGLVQTLAQERAQLVLANIVADVIIPLAPMVSQLMDPQGTFLCSGIIDTRGDEVAAALEAAGLAVTGRREKNGWIALEARLG